MRILHLIHSADPRSGGPIEAVYQLSRVHRDLGHTAEIASLDDPGAAFAVSPKEIPIHALGPGYTSFGFSRRFLPWVRRNEARFDAFLVHGLWQYHGFATRRALLGRRPYFVFPHGMLDPYFKRTYPLKHLKKRLFWPWGDYRVLRDAEGVLFTCEEERVLARQSFPLYRCRELVAGLGTGEPPAEAEAQMQAFYSAVPQVTHKRFLLFLGRLHVKKGCDLLIDAFAKVARQSDLHLVMAGPDQTGWQTELQQRAENLGISARIIWPGMLSGEVKWGAFRCADAFILPSHQENFGLAVAEALSCGLPVLISDKVNIWREVERAGAGLIESDTLEGTARLLLRWQGLSVEQRKAMRRSARTCFRESFEITTRAETLLRTITPLPKAVDL